MTEFVKWAADARMLIFGVLLIFIYSLVIDPLMGNAVLMGEPVNILEPFIAVENSGLLLLFFSLVKRKTMGFVLCGFIISMGTALCSVKTKLMWSMPMANSIIWLHYTEYFSEPVMPLWFSVCYLCTAVLLLMVLCFYAIRKFNYDKLT